MKSTDKCNISKYLKFMHNEDDLIEIAALVKRPDGREVLYSGYFKNDKEGRRKILNNVKKLNANGIYVTLNPCKASIAKDRLRGEIGRVKERTRDEEIASINNILIDIDPVRPSGTSSTDKEHKEAIALAKKIRRDLKKLGFPSPLLSDSGNGAHLIFKTKLANTEQNIRLIRELLSALARQYNTNSVRIDTSVSNPGRLVKLAGTVTRKGKSSTKRPHRMARIIKAPTSTKKLSADVMERFVREKNAEPRPPEQWTTESQGFLDVPAYLKRYGVPLLKVKSYRGGTLYVLKHCLFNSKHAPGKASIFQASNGMLSFKCFHSSCADKRWHDVRQAISGHDDISHFYKVIYRPGPKPEDITPFSFMRASTLTTKKLKERPLIKGLLEKGGSLLIIGPAGIGKSMMTFNVALNLGVVPEDGRLWETFDIPKPVGTLIVQSENGLFHMQRRLQLMAKGNPRYEEAFERISFASIRNDCRVRGDLRESHFRDTLIDLLIKTEARLLIIDPFISFHTENENDNADIRKVLDSLTEVCDLTKSSCILIHHRGKTTIDNLFAGRGASSIADWASNVLLLNQRDKDGEKQIEVNHVKSRNFKRQPPFLLKLTGELDFVKVSDDEENSVRIVVQVLKDLGGEVASQTEFAKAIMKAADVSDSTARRMIETAETAGKCSKDKNGGKRGYKLI